MPQNPVQSTLFVTRLIAGFGVKLSPTAGSGIVTVTATGGGTGKATVNTAIATVGAGVLTGAAIAGGVITRSGSTAAYSDATDTAAAIVAAIPGATVGLSFPLTVTNTTAFPETITGGANVTMSGYTIIQPNSTGTFLVTLTSLTAVAIQGLAVGNNVSIPPTQYKTLNATTGVLAAGLITGAATTVLLSTNATPGAQTTRTAAQMLADIPGAQVGFSYVLRILNSGAGVFTLTGDATVTVTGTATIAQNIWRDYVVTFTTATAATMQSIGSGVSP